MLAVINELSRHDPQLEVIFVTDRKFGAQARSLLKNADTEVEVRQVLAGKFRRYHGVPWIQQLLDIPTLLKNIRDLFYFAIGTVQSVWLVLRFKPDVIFTKGGFVCVPVGLAAKLFGVPLVIHDSDAHPGLANRILARWAATIATGSPLENYDYPAAKSKYVGIPVDNKYKPVNSEEQKKYKAEIGLPDITKPLVVITGGGLGAKNINIAAVSVAPKLIEYTAVFHITGENTFKETRDKAPSRADYMIVPFVSDKMHRVFGAADVVVTRAGATAMQELAGMAKPVVIVPNPKLTGGHQLKNASVYRDAGAAVVLDEEEMRKHPDILLDALKKLVTDESSRRKLGEKLGRFAKTDAAVNMAHLIVAAAHKAARRNVQT